MRLVYSPTEGAALLHCAFSTFATRVLNRTQVAQQWTGINVILYYAAALFTRMGIEEAQASTTLVIVNALLLCVGTVPGMILVEHK